MNKTGAELKRTTKKIYSLFEECHKKNFKFYEGKPVTKWHKAQEEKIRLFGLLESSLVYCIQTKERLKDKKLSKKRSEHLKKELEHSEENVNKVKAVLKRKKYIK